MTTGEAARDLARVENATTSTGPAHGLLKGLPASLHGGDDHERQLLGQSIFTDGFLPPVAVLIESAVRRNSATMAAFCSRHGVSLCPHGKTTMSPELFQLQLDDGAWGITAATVSQADVMRRSGVRRILIANEVATAAEVQWIGRALTDDPALDVMCYVDSIDGVDLIERVLAADSPAVRLPVLIEVGVRGGRGGVRDLAAAREVLAAISKSPHLRLRGTAAFEGVIKGDDQQPLHERVQEFLAFFRDLTISLNRIGAFDETEEIVVSAGGSAHFDHVIAALRDLELDAPTRLVLRSGCYLTHSDGGYDLVSPMGSTQPRFDDTTWRLEPAMEVWGPVLSRPEPDLAIIGIGRRDIAHDMGMPPVRGARTARGEPLEITSTAAGMYDQHTILRLDASAPLRPGTFVSLGVTHPCTTFDKWRVIPMVDDDYRVQRLVHCHF